MKRPIEPILLASLALLTLPSPAHAGPSADSARVYKGQHGEEVDVVMLRPAESHSAIIRFGGTTSALDGLSLPFKHSVDGNRELFTTQWRGRDFSFVQIDKQKGDRVELYSPDDVRRSRPLAYDDTATKKLKAKDVIKQNEKQQKDGTVANFAAFHRPEEQATHDKTLADAAAQVEKDCGQRPAVKIDWQSVSDDKLKRYSIGGFCAPPLEAMSRLCKEAKVAGGMLGDKVKQVTCHFAGPMKLVVSAGQLDWNVDGDSSNADDFAQKQLEELEVAPASAAASGDATAKPANAEAPPWGDAHTLGQRITLARAGVCADGKGHYVVSAPQAPGGSQLFYGDAKRLNRVPVAEMLEAGAFFEPRFANPTANPSFRGADVRLYSFVEYDDEKQTCTVRCGTRKSDLKQLPTDSVLTTLANTTWAPPLTDHLPHALVRDDKGNYYLVDKGATPETAKHFRLFAGKKGNLKLQAMTNVVSDSQGEIFTTKKGELRFIVGPKGSESTWVKGKARTKLLAVPIEENWQMIYNDLGVYTGERRGTPCDDL